MVSVLLAGIWASSLASFLLIIYGPLNAWLSSCHQSQKPQRDLYAEH